MKSHLEGSELVLGLPGNLVSSLQLRLLTEVSPVCRFPPPCVCRAKLTLWDVEGYTYEDFLVAVRKSALLSSPGSYSS